MKIQYFNNFLDLTLTQFSGLVYTFKASHNDYKRSNIIEYFKMLEINHLYNKFVKIFFEKLE